jgi:hypothetical protein
MKRYFLYTAAMVLAALTACSDESGEPGKVEIKFDHTWGTNTSLLPLEEFLIHPITGDSIKFSRLRYYISNIVLIHENGSEWAEPESYHLITVEDRKTAKLEIQDVPEGNYQGFRFLIGVDSLRNVSGAQEGALSPTQQMFWNWNTGYIFVRAEGQSPQSSDSSFTFHLGGFSGPNSAIRELSYDFGNKRLRVRNSAKPQIHMMADVSRIWNADSPLSALNRVHMPGANAAALSLRFASGFSYDHLHN